MTQMTKSILYVRNKLFDFMFDLRVLNGRNHFYIN